MERRTRCGVDVITVPTKDGVQVGLEATVFFRFVGETDPVTLSRFDQSVGTRKFETTDGRMLYLIEHRSSDLQHYVVRAYDLGAQQLVPGRIADKAQSSWVMARWVNSRYRYWP